MQFERVNQYLQTGANIGVILSILFLALQISRTEDVMKAQTRSTLSSRSIEMLWDEAANADLANIVRRSYDREELSADEQFRLDRLHQAYFRGWEDSHYQYRVGLFDEEEYNRLREAWRLRLARPGVTDFWCRMRSYHSAAFAMAINDLLERECA